MSYADDYVRKTQAPGPPGPYVPGSQGPYPPGSQGPYPPGSPGPYGAGAGPYGAHRGPLGSPYGIQDPKSMDGPYKFSREELHVLKQCNTESFYGRCVPLMTALGLGAYYGVHLGYSKAHPKYGATPKVLIGLIVGFIGGKLSYKNKCEEKILALPGGKLKEAVLARRKTKDGILSQFNEGVYSDASMSYAMPYVGGNLQQSEAKSIAELDTDRPYDSFDDSFRSNSEDETEQLPIPPSSRSVTYDELRLRNRVEYDNRRNLYRSGPLDDYAPYNGALAPPPPGFQDIGSSVGPPPPMQPIQSPPVKDAAQLYTTQSKSPPQRKNLYGDVVEK